MTAATDPATQRPRALGRHFMLLCSLLLLMSLIPVFDDQDWGEPINGVAALITILFGLKAVASEPRTLVIAAVLGGIATLLSSYSYFTGVDYVLAMPFQLAFYAFITLSILRSVLAAPTISADVICGAIAVYLLLGITWAIIFGTIEMLTPGAIRATNDFDPTPMQTPNDFIYFAFVTLTTLGYGDYVPVSKAARMGVVWASISGSLYIAVFIGRLVGLTTSQSARRRD